MLRYFLRVAALVGCYSAFFISELLIFNTNTLSVLAEEPTTIVITPSRIKQDIKKVGSSISIITKDEIKSKKLHNLADLLRTIQGVQVVQSGGLGSISSIFIRGASSSQVLVLIDSVPVNEVNSGQFDFSDLSTLAIERVEVLRGSQSVIYGSSALGGVINIITDKSTVGENSKNVSIIAEGGSYQSQKYLAQGNYSCGELGGNLGISFFDTNNISQANAKNGNTENDPYQNTSVNSNLTYSPSNETKVSTSLRYTRGKSELDNFDFLLGAIDALDYQQLREAYQSSLQAETTFGVWSPKLILGYNQENYKAFDPVTDFNNYQLKSNTTSLQQQNLFKIDNVFSSLAGYSFNQNDGVNVGSFDKTRSVNSLFIEQFVNPNEDLGLSIGGRYDNDSTFGEVVTYRGSLAQQLVPLSSKLHSTYGTGFRAPSFSDLYFPNFSNPELDPEKSRGFDVGIESKISKVTTDVTFFHITYADLISFNNTTFIPENIQSARSHGIEGKVKLDLTESTNIGLSYTYLDAKNISTNTLLPRRARHQGGVSISNSYFEEVIMRSDVNYLADRIESDGSNMDDYFVVSAVMEYQLTENISPYIRMQNMLDKDYEEVKGYGTLGYSVFFGLQYQM